MTVARRGRVEEACEFILSSWCKTALVLENYDLICIEGVRYDFGINIFWQGQIVSKNL
jgi:hypothetical protein